MKKQETMNEEGDLYSRKTEIEYYVSDQSDRDAAEQHEAECELDIQKMVEQERRELEPLECEHDFETVDRLDKDTVLQVCLVCDFERTIEK